MTVDLGGLPVYVYGNSYSLLPSAQTPWFTGPHYSELVAADGNGGAVTSYGVGGERSAHAVYSMLVGGAPAYFHGVHPAALWQPDRSGLVILETLGNDIGHYPAMNVSPVVPAPITTENTNYLDSLRGMYRTLIAVASNGGRIEQDAGTTYTGAWGSLAGFYSGSTVFYTSAPGATVTFDAVTPPQAGELVGMVYALALTLAPGTGVNAPLSVTVDGGTPTPVVLPPWEPYVGDNGTNIVIGAPQAIPIEVPVDGQSHSVTITHAGAADQFFYIDAMVIPSDTPNTVAVMGRENPITTGVFDQAGVDTWMANAPMVCAVAQDVAAEFPNAVYVPSTATLAGISSDGVHPNNTGMEQIAADLWAALDEVAPPAVAQVTAEVQAFDPPRVQVTITGLPVDTGTITLYRIVGGGREPVRGAINIPHTGDAHVFTDNAAPFGVPVSYVVVAVSIEDNVTETYSNAITLTTDLPWISHPITGQGVSLTIETWPELAYAARQSLVAVSGRAAPIVVSDVRTAAASEMTVITRTRAQLVALRELLATGDVLQVRPVCDAIETEFVAIGDVTEARIKETSRSTDPGTPAGSDWRRRVSMALQVADQPAPQIAAVGDTLQDLADFVPGTLADLAVAFGPGATLLTIATADLSGGA